MSPRRLRLRQIFGFILLGLVLIAVVEIAVAVLVARVIGPWPTILLIVAFAALGMSVVRRGGARSLLALRDAMAARRLPGGEMADPVMLLVGGFLMLPPGFILDLLGLLFVLPFTRPAMRGLCGALLRVSFFNRVVQSWPSPGAQVVQGEVIHDGDPGEAGRPGITKDPGITKGGS